MEKQSVLFWIVCVVGKRYLEHIDKGETIKCDVTYRRDRSGMVVLIIVFL